MDRWLRTQCAWGIALALVSWAGWLAATAMGMSGLPAAQALTPDVLGTVLLRTTFGQVWSLRLALLAVVAALLVSQTGRPAARQPLAAVLALGLVASLAWTGHALGTSRAHVWIDAIHLVAAAVWLGMLPLLWLVTSRAVSQPASWRELALACARRFFLPGLAAVLVLALSGLANTAWMLDSPADLVNTGYGRVLALKLALFASMMVLAGVNRLLLVPKAQRLPAALGQLRTSVMAELALGAAVLAVVAWLGVTPPAAHDHPAHRMENM